MGWIKQYKRVALLFEESRYIDCRFEKNKQILAYDKSSICFKIQILIHPICSYLQTIVKKKKNRWVMRYHFHLHGIFQKVTEYVVSECDFRLDSNGQFIWKNEGACLCCSIRVIWQSHPQDHHCPMKQPEWGTCTVSEQKCCGQHTKCCQSMNLVSIIKSTFSLHVSSVYILFHPTR